jgi:hypothetical protein
MTPQAAAGRRLGRKYRILLAIPPFAALARNLPPGYISGG